MYFVDNTGGENPLRCNNISDGLTVMLLTKDNKVKYVGDLSNIDVPTALKNVFAGKDVAIIPSDGKKALDSIKAWLDEVSSKYAGSGLVYQPFIVLVFNKNFTFNGKKAYDTTYDKFLLRVVAKDIDQITKYKSFTTLQANKTIQVDVQTLPTIKITLPTDCAGTCKGKKIPPPFFYDETAKKLYCPKCEPAINSDPDVANRKALLYLNFDAKKKQGLGEILDSTKGDLNASVTSDINSFSCQICGNSAPSATMEFGYVNLLEIFGFASCTCDPCFQKAYVNFAVQDFSSEQVSALNLNGPASWVVRKYPLPKADPPVDNPDNGDG